MLVDRCCNASLLGKNFGGQNQWGKGCSQKWSSPQLTMKTPPSTTFFKKKLVFWNKMHVFNSFPSVFFYLRVFYRHCMIISPFVRSCGVFTACSRHLGSVPCYMTFMLSDCWFEPFWVVNTEWAGMLCLDILSLFVFKRMNKHVDVVTVVRIWLISLWADVTSAERIPGV